MKFKNLKIYQASWILCILLVLVNYLPFYATWVFLGLLSLAFFIFNIIQKRKIFPDLSFFIVLIYLILVSIVGVLNTRTYGLWPYLRDIIYISGALVYTYTFFNFGEKWNISKNDFYKGFFLYSVITSIVFIISFFLFGKDVNKPNEWTLAFGLLLVFIMKEKCFGKIIDLLLKLVIVISFVLAFSRTSLIVFAILFVFSISDYKKMLPRLIIASSVVLLIAFVFLRETMLSYIYKIARSLTEISINNDWTIKENIVNNWRGYEVYCAQLMIGNGSLLNKIIGFGAGSFIDVFGYAFLVTTENNIPYLHNGYYTVLIKGGIVGLSLYIFYFIGLFYLVRKNIMSKQNRRFLYGIILASVISIWVISGVFHGSQLLFCAIFYLTYLESKNQENSLQDKTGDEVSKSV